MKKTIVLLFIFLPFINFSQVKLDKIDLNNLVAIGELYSKNLNVNGEDFINTINSLRTLKLNNVVETLIETGKGDNHILLAKYLTRPNDEELLLWYVIREIHYNQIKETKFRTSNLDIANKVLSQNIDKRILLDNYYYIVRGGISKLFNDADLSNINIEIEKLGFKNQDEKSIFFLNMVDALIGPRFKVLLMVKKNDKIVAFSEKMPTFDGKKYYYYTNLDFEDFDWIAYDKTQSYKQVNMDNLYWTLIAHFFSVSQLKTKSEAQDIYFNSILHQPKYFKFSSQEKDLQFLYDKSK